MPTQDLVITGMNRGTTTTPVYNHFLPTALGFEYMSRSDKRIVNPQIFTIAWMTVEVAISV